MIIILRDYKLVEIVRAEELESPGDISLNLLNILVQPLRENLMRVLLLFLFGSSWRRHLSSKRREPLLLQRLVVLVRIRISSDFFRHLFSSRFTVSRFHILLLILKTDCKIVIDQQVLIGSCILEELWSLLILAVDDVT